MKSLSNLFKKKQSASEPEPAVEPVLPKSRNRSGQSLFI